MDKLFVVLIFICTPSLKQRRDNSNFRTGCAVKISLDSWTKGWTQGHCRGGRVGTTQPLLFLPWAPAFEYRLLTVNTPNGVQEQRHSRRILLKRINKLVSSFDSCQILGISQCSNRFRVYKPFFLNLRQLCVEKVLHLRVFCSSHVWWESTGFHLTVPTDWDWGTSLLLDVKELLDLYCFHK